MQGAIEVHEACIDVERNQLPIVTFLNYFVERKHSQVLLWLHFLSAIKIHVVARVEYFRDCWLVHLFLLGLTDRMVLSWFVEFLFVLRQFNKARDGYALL